MQSIYSHTSDPLPFQWLAREKPLCSNTKFIDVDYEPLMETKREIIFNQSDMKGLLHSVVPGPVNGEPAVIVDSQEYSALGCDLRNLRKLGKLLRSVVDLEDSMILCIAEDSTCYMRMEAANALISWTSGLSAGDYAIFPVNSDGGHGGGLTICRRNLLHSRAAQP